MSDAKINPYAAPLDDCTPQVVDDGQVWRDGPLMVVRKGSSLPDRCVRCNAPAEGRRLKRPLRWHPVALALVIIGSFLSMLGTIPFPTCAWLSAVCILVLWGLYFVLATIGDRKVKLHVGICRKHWTLELIPKAVIVLVCLTAASAAVTVGLANSGPFVARLLFWAGIYQASGRILTPKKSDPTYIWLLGACRAYLAELPQWPPPGATLAEPNSRPAAH